MTELTARGAPALAERLRALSPERQLMLAQALRMQRESPSAASRAGSMEVKAFIIPRGSTAAFIDSDLAQLGPFLKERLPEFMVPGRFAVLESLPLLPNGKVDKNALAQLATPASAPDSAAGAPAAVDENILKTMQAIWSEVLGVEEIYPEDNFFELGGDSLLSINVVSRARKQDIYLGPGELFDFPVLSQLCAHLTEESGRRAADPAGFEARKMRSENTGGEAPPLFMVHGGSRLLKQLRDALGPEQPIHLIPAHWEQADVNFGITLEALAEDALERLRETTPQGPYLLGGYSFGAVIAFEMARRLLALGEEIRLLFMLDPPENPEVFKSVWSDYERLADVDLPAKPRTSHVERLKSLSLPERLGYVFSKLKGHIAHYVALYSLDSKFLIARACNRLGLSVPAPLRKLYVFRTYLRAARQYEIRPLDLPVLLFRAMRGSHRYSPAVWRSMAGGGLTLREFDCKHIDLQWDEAVVEECTTLFRSQLEELNAGAARPASGDAVEPENPAAAGRAVGQ